MKLLVFPGPSVVEWASPEAFERARASWMSGRAKLDRIAWGGLKVC
jgi:hypothetical protein